MKQKITLLVLAAMMVVAGSFAQGSQQTARTLKQMKVPTTVVGKQKAKQQVSKQSLLRQVDKNRLQSRRDVMLAHKKTGVKAAQPAAQRRAAGIIYDQPAGTQKCYERSGSAYYTFWGYIMSTTLESSIGNVVFGADGKVYIKDIISQAGLGTWVEGTLSGDKITLTFPQKLGDSGQGYGFDVVAMDYDAAGQTYVQSANQTVTLNYDAATGAITSSGALQSGDTVLGLIYDDDFSWIGYADWNITMTAVTDPLVEAPAGLTTETYSLSADGYEGSLVQVGFSGSDIYVQGIDRNLPDTWVKGTVSGNKVTFKSGQYVGADEVAGYHQYLFSATATQEYDPDYDEYYTSYTLSDADIVFDYDAASKTLSNSTCFLLNAGKSSVYYLYAFDKAVIKPFVEVAATPATPAINELYEGGWNYYSSGYGWGYLDFDMQTADVDGNYIIPEKLSYALWTRVNGEEKQLTFSVYDYQYLDELQKTEIPFGFTENWDFYANGLNTQVYYYIVGPEAYGVQAIYRGAGVERRSEIAWVEAQGLGADVQPAAATPAYNEATVSAADNRIDYGFYTGDEAVNTVTNNYKPETYDVAIHLGDPAVVGTAIESITFPLQQVQGVTDLNVFLTSQLRVENGKNVADLAVKAVTPAEAGFITVTLDKPYLIPEGGVYVGYSMTITDTSSDENAMPIAITNKANAGGFYLHTSDGYLKWLDVVEGYGGSALIQVKLAGSAVKTNAASVSDLEQQYVMTGKTFTVPVTVTNHGSKGIQTVNVLYNVAGQDGSQTVNVNVDGFFGKTATFNLDVPAIASKGNYELVVKVDKVNGVANEDALNSTTIPVVALNSVPKKRTLLEEYTGLWCGYCPRGYVGLEKLAELYPNEYVLVSYHNGDDMEIMPSNNFPSLVSGFPAGWMDRAVEVDAYYGIVYGQKDFGIADDLAARNKQFCHADITFTSELSSDQQTVNINAEVTFPFDLVEGNYAVEYILTADGLQNDNWGQSNYYANGAMGYPQYMDQFTNGGSTIYGLVFNDVAVLTSEQLGGSGNAVTAATAEQPVQLHYAFSLADAVNTSYMPVIQDVSKLKVVALLIDKTTGAVVNANQAKLGETTGISIREAAQQTVAAVTYHDLSGRQVSRPAHGIYVQTVKYQNGQTVTRKVVMK